jgi:hypothetical protein
LEDVSWRCSHVTELVANIRVYIRFRTLLAYPTAFSRGGGAAEIKFNQKSKMGMSAEGKVWVRSCGPPRQVHTRSGSGAPMSSRDCAAHAGTDSFALGHGLNAVPSELGGGLLPEHQFHVTVPLPGSHHCAPVTISPLH